MKLKGWKFIRSDHRMQFTDQRELIAGQAVSYTHLTLPTNREV